jgi:hypothetical protein
MMQTHLVIAVLISGVVILVTMYVRIVNVTGPRLSTWALVVMIMDGRGNVKNTFAKQSVSFLVGIGQTIRSPILVALVRKVFVAWVRFHHAPKSRHLVNLNHSVHAVILELLIVGKC